MTDLSMVMISRNDNYGKNLIHRMQLSINSVYEFFERYSVDTELILIEWNPPPDNPSLQETLNFPDGNDAVSCRLITVPSKIHNQLPGSENTPLFEYRGKNVGIRRANGEYILCTNPDIIFNKELARYIKNNEIDSNSFYRIDRYDVQGLAPLSRSIEDSIDYCRNNVFRVSRDNNDFEYVDNLHRAKKISKILLFYLKNNPIKIAKKVLRIPKATDEYKKEMKSGTKHNLNEIYTHVSGDFLMMSRKKWHQISGYSEETSDLHIDSKACVAAIANGCSQTVIDNAARIYHQEHDRTDRLTRESKNWETFVSEAHKILNEGLESYRNESSWGLANFDLEEEYIV